MGILQSQEQLAGFEISAFPHNSPKSRKEIFKRVRSVAIPNELNTTKIHTAEEAGAKIRKLLGVKS